MFRFKILFRFLASSRLFVFTDWMNFCTSSWSLVLWRVFSRSLEIRPLYSWWTLLSLWLWSRVAYCSEMDYSNMLSSADASWMVWSSDIWLPIFVNSKLCILFVFSCSLTRSARLYSMLCSSRSLWRYFCLILSSRALICSVSFSLCFFLKAWVDRSFYETASCSCFWSTRLPLMSVLAVIRTVVGCLYRSVLPRRLGRFV